MGEALISRTGNGESETSIPVLPDYHTLIVTLRDYDNAIIPNYTINCKDGTSWYNYTTNDKGQVMFTTNSGSANITVYNNLTGVRYLDFVNTIFNVDCPLGQYSKHNIVLTGQNGPINLTNGNYMFLKPKTCTINVCGGGGGGGGGGGDDYEGQTGGNGYVTNVTDNFESNNQFRVIIGSGGRMGYALRWEDSTHSGYGGTGGTTSIRNYSANGGSGGNFYIQYMGTPDRPANGGPGFGSYGRGGSGGIGYNGNGRAGGSGIVCINFT